MLAAVAYEGYGSGSLGGVPPDEVIPGRQKHGMVSGGIEIQQEWAGRELARLRRKADKLAVEIEWMVVEAGRALRAKEPGGAITEEQLKNLEEYEARRRRKS